MTLPAADSIARPVDLNLRTYKAAIYETLTRMVAELELSPGTRLVEAELAARFNVSKTPIREALLLLESDGLVKLEPYQGATVTWLSLEEYQELLFIQDALEQPALPLVTARISPRELDAVGRIIERMKRLRREGDSRAFFEAGAQMHERLFSVVHSPRLIRIVMSLILHPSRRYERVFMHQFEDAWDVEMAVITGRFENIRAGDPEAAALSVREGRARMLDLVQGRLDHPRIAPFLAPRTGSPPPAASRTRAARRGSVRRTT